jgi:hypothetical protein
MDNSFPQGPELNVSLYAQARSPKRWVLLLAIIAAALFILFLVVRQIKPVTLRNQATLAAPIINVNWQLLEPDTTVSSKVYRSTSQFFDDPNESALVAIVPSPTNTYADTSVSTGVTYYYTIFEFDSEGVAFDPSYITASAIDGGDVPPSPNPQINPADYRSADINCSGTVFYVNSRLTKEGYPSAEVFYAWRSSFSGIPPVSDCSLFPTERLVRLPDSSLVKVPSSQTVWKIEGNTARPVASLAALYRIAAQPKIITISVEYLHTYSGGVPVY